MSQPRRRRRRRRRGGRGAGAPSASAQGAGAPAEQTEGLPEKQPEAGGGEAAGADASARSRRRRRARGPRPTDEASSALEGVRRRPPATLTAPPDGRTLEGVIGELQSIWGVPQNPQEYRITVKVADERDNRGRRVSSIEEVREERPVQAPGGGGRPRREKAPAAPRIGDDLTESGAERTTGTTRRRRSRRRRRKGRSGSS
jgi:hypothetical protein